MRLALDLTDTKCRDEMCPVAENLDHLQWPYNLRELCNDRHSGASLTFALGSCMSTYEKNAATTT